VVEALEAWQREEDGLEIGWSKESWRKK